MPSIEIMGQEGLENLLTGFLRGNFVSGRRSHDDYGIMYFLVDWQKCKFNLFVCLFVVPEQILDVKLVLIDCYSYCKEEKARSKLRISIGSKTLGKK